VAAILAAEFGIESRPFHVALDEAVRKDLEELADGEPKLSWLTLSSPAAPGLRPEPFLLVSYSEDRYQHVKRRRGAGRTQRHQRSCCG
jgi:hypothetical protein